MKGAVEVILIAVVACLPAVVWVSAGTETPGKPPCVMDNFAFGDGNKGLLPAMREPVVPVKKKAWEAALGGEVAAKPHIRSRLAGWPQRVLVDRSTLPQDDDAFLRRLASDTWRGLAALTDRENGLPIDNLGLGKQSVAPADSRIGDYTSGTNIGLYLAAVVAAHDLRLIDEKEALERLRRLLDTLDRLEKYRGFFFNFYDTTSLERTSHFISFVDSSWLTAGLLLVRQAFPPLAARCNALMAEGDYGFFYDPVRQLASHGYYTHLQQRSPFDYGVFYTEARLGVLIAIGKGQIPLAPWFGMIRTFPAECAGQTMLPTAITTRMIDGFRFSAGCYEWQGLQYVPSWGGSMFEALMPTLLLDEQRYAPRSLGINGKVHAIVQRRYALETLGYPVWGISPSATPVGDDYGEYGVPVLGSRGYTAGAITPHATALALSVTPEAAVANLRRLAQRYDIYGDFGFYDSVDPRSGDVAYSYLALDQSMLFLAVANHLSGNRIPARFAADPIVQKVLPVIAVEDFFDGRNPLGSTVARR